MDRPRGFAANLAFPLAFAMLAGCAGSPAAAPKVAEPSVLEFAPDAEVDADRGAIRGFVVDAELNPIPATQLLLRPTDKTATSAADGSFVFSMLAADIYTVYASRLGFMATEVVATVRAGETTQVDIPLAAVVVVQPRKEVIGPFEGYFQCRWAGIGSGSCGYVGVAVPGGIGVGSVDTSIITNAVWTNDNTAMKWKLTGEDWSEIVFEAKWTPSSAATNSEMSQLFSHDGRKDGHLFMKSAPQASPLWTNYTPSGPHAGAIGRSPLLPNQTLTMLNWLAVGVGGPAEEDPHPVSIAYEMRFQAMVTVFYLSTAPKGYTALPA